ncbi:FAD/NAD(P)-binding protein [Streptomyces sp. NRRL S-244]|uniref:FAD/NAD(P)-binding protein n=1 Tax=Streptomyces sp. NRRL S-244 TaxID=1463897 RepID=UPI000B2C500A|nr:FAD/NAD(P)-binding protein [Streptomyces sp. NRRL S-244]
MSTSARTDEHGDGERWLTVCVIGSGPRGLSVLERLAANADELLPAGVRLRVHLVDPRPGSGQVWRSDQSRHLLMNTVASQVTLFTDDSVTMDGPVRPGPSLAEWAADPALHGGASPAGDEVPGPDGYPTRALYGRYLEWVLRGVVRRGPADIRTHPARAVRLDADTSAGGLDRVTLDDGTVLSGLDAVVLAQGHLPVSPAPAEAAFARFAARRGLCYLPPGNPAEARLDGIEPGEPVLLRGLGLNFFDHMALLTEGRGGVYEAKDAGLVYHRSGREPVLYAGSRRGVPYQARGENQKGAHGRHLPLVLTPAAVARLRRGPRRPRFRCDIWPLVSQEVETVYYAALLRAGGRPEAAARLLERSASGPWTPYDRDRLLDVLGVPAGRRWDWDRVARPCADRVFADRAAFTGWLLEHLRRDVAEAHAGNVDGPYKAALDVLRDLRNEVRLLVDHGGISGADYRDELTARYGPLNAYLSIGPPPRRIREAIALIEAGVLTVLGPGAEFGADEAAGRFTARSPRVGGDAVHARAFIDARLPEPDVVRTEDPLLGYLYATGQCVPYVIDDERGPYRTGGIAVTERPYHVIDATGAAHERRFAYGVPTEGVHWVTAAGARPGVDSVILGDSDAMARGILRLARGADRRFDSLTRSTT